MEFNLNGLYKLKVLPERFDKHGMDNYWCKNFTYIPQYYENVDKWYMIDTYFNSNTTLVTEDNINDFEFVFDFREVRQIPDNEYNEYNEKDLIRVPTDSGGWTCGGLYWIKKGTEKSVSKQIEKLKFEQRQTERHLISIKEQIKELERRTQNE